MLARRLSLLLTALVTIPSVACAQSFASTDAYSLGVSPQFPSPFGTVMVSPTSGSLDLSNATMTVTANGKPIYQGNAKPVLVTLGASGALTTVLVTMTVNGKPYPKTIAIRPQDVVLVLEPIASAPALYRGKPLVPLEGAVRVVAVSGLQTAQGALLDSRKLSYSWVVDDTRITNASGIGRDTLVVASPEQYRSRDISVSVSSQDGVYSGGAAVSLDPQEPTVRLYESDPLLGVLFNHALSDSYAINSSEKTLFAAPYSFPTNSTAPVLKWFLNGTAAQTGPTITLRPTGSGQGSANLSLVASGGESITETSVLSVSFGAARGGLGIFGL